MPSTSNDFSLVLIGAALTMAVSACTDFAGPIPGTEQTTEANNGSTGNGSTGNGSTGNGSTGNGSTGNGSTGNGSTGNGDGMGAMPPPNNSGMNDDLVSFDEDVHPILVTMCGECHSEPAGGLPGHGAADPDASFESVTSMTAAGEPVYQRILARAAGTGGFMPPGYTGCEALGTEGCLTQEEYDTIALWVQQGAMNR